MRALSKLQRVRRYQCRYKRQIAAVYLFCELCSKAAHHLFLSVLPCLHGPQ